MPERHRLQPLDADVNTVAFVAARDAEVFSLGRAATDKDRIEALGQQLAHAVYRGVEPEVHAHIGDVVDFLVHYRSRQPERRDVGAHQTAGLVQRLVDDALVSQGHQIVGHRKRRAAGADQSDPLAVFLFWRHGEPVADITAIVRGHALQPADRHGFVLDTTASADRLAGAIADPPEYPREDVGLAVQHVGVAEAAERNQANVLRHVGVGGTAPLAVHYLVKVLGAVRVGGFHWQPAINRRAGGRMRNTRLRP